MCPKVSLETSPRHDPSVASFAFRILLASLTMIFAATLIAYGVVRANNEVWRTAEMPALPWGLLGSTVLLAGVSAALETALARVRRNEVAGARVALKIAVLCVVAFLVGQTWNWQQMMLPATAPLTLYPFTFFMLTGTHALHVLGGMVPMGVVLWRSSRDEYTSSSHQGLLLCAQYWHYLGVVWLVLMTALWLGS